MWHIYILSGDKMRYLVTIYVPIHFVWPSYFVIKLTDFAITPAICNKTVRFCNKKPDAFCNKLLSYFVINCYKEPNETATTINSQNWFSSCLVPWSCYCQCPLFLHPLREGAFLQFYLNKNAKTALNSRLKFGNC